MKVRPAYRLRYIPSRYGRPDASAKPAAAGAPVSGTGITRSASIGCSSASCIAHLASGLVQVAALHVRIGPGEVDELEDAQRGRRLGEADGARRLAGLEDDHLAGLDVADVFGADDVERGGLGRQAPADRGVVAAPQAVVGVDPAAGRQPAEDERPEPERIAHADDPALVEDHQAVRAADARQDALQGLDRVGRGLVGEERGQQLRVGRRRQAGTAAAQLARAGRAC